MIVDLRNCDHPNILKYFDSFIIQNYHFILLEGVERSLYDVVLQHSGSDQFNQSYFNITIQLLKGLDYLHSKNLFLHIPTLKSIFVDKNMNVKFLYFQTQQNSDKNELTTILSYFDHYKLPFIPPEDFILENDQQEIHYKENLTVEGNIWSICMCLYEMAGASYLQQKQFALGIDSYKLQFQVHYMINLILQRTLQRDIQQRPKLNDLMVFFQSAQQWIDQIKESQQSEAEIEMFAEVQKEFDNQKYLEALNILQKLLQSNQCIDKYLAWIGRCYCAINQLDESEYWSSQSLKINPNNDISYFNLGNIWKIRKNFEKAINFFQRSIDCNPKNIYSMNNLGLIYDSQSMEAQAQQMYLRAIEIQPEKQFLYYNMGRSFYLQSNYEEAKKWFLKTLDIDPTYHKSLTYLGEIEFIQNNHQEAMVYFHKSLKVSPNENTYFSLGTQYYKNGNISYSNNNHSSIIVIGKSSTQSFTIIIDSFEGLQSFQRSNKIKKLEEMIVDLRNCDHPNILKYFDSFIIQNYHFILLESVERSLYDVTLQHSDSDQFNQSYVSITIQLLKGLDYLHSKNLFLHIPTLKSIFVDKNMNVKFLYFQTQQNSDKNVLTAILSKFEDYKLPFIPPEDFILENDQQEIHYKENLTRTLQRDIQQRPRLNDLMIFFQSAQQWIDSVKESQQSEAEIEMFAEAKRQFDNQKFLEALNILFKLLQNNQGIDKYLVLISRCYYAMNQLDEAEYWSSQSLKINPNNEICYFNLGNISKIRKEYEKAKHFYYKSIDCNPKNIYSMNNLGQIYDIQTMDTSAQEMYLRAIEIKPEKQFLYHNMGKSFYLKRNYEEAKKWFLKTLEIDPTYHKSLTYLGEMESIQNNYKEAIVYFKKLLKVSPNEISYFSLSNQYYKIRKYSNSQVLMKDAEKKLESNRFYFYSATTYYMKKKYNKAIYYCKKAFDQKQNEQRSLELIKKSKNMI
ncbi:tetratricopeptide repeat protein (macronuclear) [Tetrahymena thermophila SB210]|uniref:Tetratricopeptide repeat protein n=1 Tax=Tetrahymena thermophila (strain SB210) TaxID=312017 RepID=Q24I03_TETTS|nr:tetratricopeptide repeat protein [Tetrahymena thermophila SB210]EAS07435.2 tetratricopeptide repeat protein [Tetrahymena thermophila SB210]|eukprot:XP_001027677.2 tetratricopeptide repeat protein [Tetrahymena thermophila SB210]